MNDVWDQWLTRRNDLGRIGPGWRNEGNPLDDHDQDYDELAGQHIVSDHRHGQGEVQKSDNGDWEEEERSFSYVLRYDNQAQYDEGELDGVDDDGSFVSELRIERVDEESALSGDSVSPAEMSDHA